VLPIERPSLPNLRRYYDTLLTRSGFTSHVALPLS
jgi:hypothetical protein